MWSNEQNNGCVRIKREFLSFFDPVAIALIAFAMLGVVITVIILLVFIMYRDLSVVRMSNPSLMALLLVALSGCLGSSVLFIGEPTTMVCQLREPIVVSWLTISTACLLSRIVQIIIENQGEKYFLLAFLLVSFEFTAQHRFKFHNTVLICSLSVNILVVHLKLQ